jgi:hypothetical protein
MNFNININDLLDISVSMSIGKRYNKIHNYIILDHHVFRLTTVTTRIIYKKGLKTLTTRIVYKIRGSSFSSKNLNLEWIKNEHNLDPILSYIQSL